MDCIRPAWMAAVLAFAVPASAETLTVMGSSPAVAGVNDLLRLSVERFEGAEGTAFAQAVEAELAAATYRGQSYFRVVAPESGAPVDGLLTGTIRENVEETGVIERRKHCEQHDAADKKKCVKEVDRDIRCRRRVATIATTVRLVAIGDGSIRYARPFNARDDITFCPDRNAPRTVEDFFAGVRRDHVLMIRRDLTPVEYALPVRVDENRKGLSKPAQDAFRNAVRLTKTDPAGACRDWTALTRDAPPTAALAFNLGLCAEMEGELEQAGDWYAEAQRQGSRNRDIAEGLSRIDGNLRAFANWEERRELAGVR